jgi:erythromycin esterase-like protein
MNASTRLLLALAAWLVTASAVAAPSEPVSPQQIEQLLKENSHSITLSNGLLSGPGADLLMRAAGGAQFFVIGEQHNAKEIPEFTSALFCHLSRTQGFRYLALEQDPVAVARASAAPLRGRLDEIARYARRYPAAFTFRTDEELAMIAEAGKVHKGSRPVWGLDQVFGATHVLDRLVEIAADARTRARTALLADEVRRVETQQLAKNARFMIPDTEKSTEFLALPLFYRRTRGSEADLLISQLFKSLDIYRDWFLAARHGQLTRYRQSFEREENMKHLFMANYEAVWKGGQKPPRVLLKFGHNHSIRGANRSGILTLGNFVSEFAKSNGLGSFHLAIYANNDQPGYYDILSTDPDYGPLMRTASPRQWAVIDLRPLRARAFSGLILGLTHEQRDLIFGFDAVLLIGSQAVGSYGLTRQSQ